MRKISHKHVILSLFLATLFPFSPKAGAPDIFDSGPIITSSPSTIRDPLGFRIDAFEALPDGLTGAVMRKIGDRVSLYFAFSLDGGETWQTPRLIDPESPNYSSIKIFQNSLIYFGLEEYMMVIYDYEYEGTQGSRAAYTYDGADWLIFDSIYAECGTCLSQSLVDVQVVSPTMLVTTVLRERFVAISPPPPPVPAYTFDVIDIAARTIGSGGNAGQTFDTEPPKTIKLSGFSTEYLTVGPNGEDKLLTDQRGNPGFGSGNQLTIEGGDLRGTVEWYDADYTANGELFAVAYITRGTGADDGAYDIGLATKGREDGAWSAPRTLYTIPAETIGESGIPADARFGFGGRSQAIAWIDLDEAGNRVRINILASFDGGATWPRLFQTGWGEFDTNPETWSLNLTAPPDNQANINDDYYNVRLEGLNPLGTRDLVYFAGIGFDFSNQTSRGALHGTITY